MWIKCISPILINFKVKHDDIKYDHNSQKEIDINENNTMTIL